MMNIVYSNDCQFDIYYIPRSTSPPPPLICFVHGGAWVSGDKREHTSLAKNLLHATGFPVAVPNYRLTPSVIHPMHVNDIVDFLSFILDWKHSPCSYDPSKLILMGHSCSAHMISSLFFLPPPDSDNLPRVKPLHPRLIDSTKAVILSEGIYDLHSLVGSFPTYRSAYLEPAFGVRYSEFSIPTSTLHPAVSFPWLLIHSVGDSLVNNFQTTQMYTHLINSRAVVAISLDDLSGEHDEILETEKYVELVKEFLISNLQNIL